MGNKWGDGTANLEEDIAVRLAAGFGMEVDVVAVLPGGNQNHVVHLRGEGRDVVVRFARDDKRMSVDPFDVEAWCAEINSGEIRTPGLIARGHVRGVSVLMQEFVSGMPASAEDLTAWKAAGRMAAALPAVDISDAPDTLFSRFGRDVNRAWNEHIAYNIDALDANDPLIELGVYEPRQVAQLRRMLGRLRNRELVQGLVHGDLSTRNLIATSEQYVVLDWGSAHAGPAPWTDLEQIQRWWTTGNHETRVSKTAWDAVLTGAGLTRKSVNSSLHELGTLHALDSAG